MAVAAKPQTSLYETTLDDADLEKQLEERDKLRTAASEARALFKEADDKAKGSIANLDLGDDAPVRVGRFVVTRKLRKPRSVSFETEAKVAYTIGTLGDED
jgi:hypothetical protein